MIKGKIQTCDISQKLTEIVISAHPYHWVTTTPCYLKWITVNVLSNYVKFELHMYITTVSDANKQLENFELHNYSD